MPLATWAIAGAVVLLLLGGILLATHHKPPTPAGVILPLDPYAPSLVFSDLQMSESASVTGLKATYIDGHVRNTGSHTVTAATLQVLFANDMQMPPQVNPSAPHPSPPATPASSASPSRTSPPTGTSSSPLSTPPKSPQNRGTLPSRIAKNFPLHPLFSSLH